MDGLRDRIAGARHKATRGATRTSAILARWTLIAFALASSDSAVAAERSDPTAVAVAEFSYVDTSGEERDQRADHAARIAAFSETLRASLTDGGSRVVAPLTCREVPCSTPESLIESARQARARILIYGGIHKMSTLVQWEQLNVVDVDDGKPVLTRLLTFRGDNDEAWRKAALYTANLVNEMISAH
ncbi:conserved exported hypothetical protein [Methylocella tundrae]|uniref:DUF2380 domain-containing protein n=1 Tax=Methylocella tundrae TaxID=227605 RepID=A0A8B6M945_METTU|nr:conserved exported hypothetical protein [Methylocella tundrae]VTZ51001.1 conserved exported hypothetical protein [Methylocella tundrae]